MQATTILNIILVIISLDYLFNLILGLLNYNSFDRSIPKNLKGIYDESAYIDSIVRDTGVEHEYIQIQNQDLFDMVDEMLFFFDEPINASNWTAFYQIARRISDRNIRVVLNGHGGDELLAGYWDHYHYRFHDLDREKDHETLKMEIDYWGKNHGRSHELSLIHI